MQMLNCIEYIVAKEREQNVKKVLNKNKNTFINNSLKSFLYVGRIRFIILCYLIILLFF